MHVFIQLNNFLEVKFSSDYLFDSKKSLWTRRQGFKKRSFIFNEVNNLEIYKVADCKTYNHLILKYVGGVRNDPLAHSMATAPVLYTVSLLSPSVYYTHDFRPKNREW